MVVQRPELMVDRGSKTSADGKTTLRGERGFWKKIYSNFERNSVAAAQVAQKAGGIRILGLFNIIKKKII